MITSKMLYMIQDERELAYMYGGPDAAYCNYYFHKCNDRA